MLKSVSYFNSPSWRRIISQFRGKIKFVVKIKFNINLELLILEIFNELHLQVDTIHDEDRIKSENLTLSDMYQNNIYIINTIYSNCNIFLIVVWRPTKSI